MGKKAEATFLSLDKKLIAIVLAVNVLFVVAWTSISFTVQNRSGREKLTQDLAYIETVILPGIANSSWKLDLNQATVQAQGLLANPNVTRVRISEGDGASSPFLDVRKPNGFQEIEEWNYDLPIPGSGGATKFATMTLYTTLEPLQARLKAEVIQILASEALQTLILSLMILYAFRVLVLNHIAVLSGYFRKTSYIARTTPYLTHKLRGHYRDEIDDLIDAINRTIDESKKYQAQIETLKDRAERANRAKSLFLASINHELRTPLNAILGVTDLVHEDGHDPQEQKQLIELQRRSGLHLLHLVDEILDFSKIEAGELKIEKRPMDVRTAFETCRLIMEKPLQEGGNRLEFHVAPGFPERILGDIDRFSQILINLVSNANKFTDRGRIHVEVTAQQDEFEMTVADTGIGIAAEKIQEIFLPFRQLEDARGNLRKGTGIGLSITKRLTEMMGGKIAVESQVGVGSLFRIHLPLKVVGKAIETGPAESHPPPQLKNRIKILVVEDTSDVQLMIRAFLRRSPVDISFAQNGQEGVEKFRSNEYSLILMDLQMPVMDGYEATRKIREIEQKSGKHAHVPILAMTALTTKNELESALRAGADGYLTKPFSRTKLLETLQKFAASQ